MLRRSARHDFKLLPRTTKRSTRTMTLLRAAHTQQQQEEETAPALSTRQDLFAMIEKSLDIEFELEQKHCGLRNYQRAEFHRNAIFELQEIKEELLMSVEQESEFSRKQMHVQAARAKKNIVLLEQEFNEIIASRKDTSKGDEMTMMSVDDVEQKGRQSGIRVSFFIRKDDVVEYGREVRLCGSCSELGCWSVSKSVVCTRVINVDEGDNLWTCDVVLSRKSVDEFQFKFLTCKSNPADGVIADIDWQPCENGIFRDQVDAETLSVNFTVDWLGDRVQERVWVAHSIERERKN